MIIVSQDKETLLNFDNIQNIRIEEYGTHEKGKKIYKIFSGNFEGYATLLGIYQTKEKAKAVLQDIVSNYQCFCHHKDEYSRFFMPQDINYYDDSYDYLPF